MEAYQTCPYNNSHRVSAKRFIPHLVKCRKANPNSEMVTCPLNAQHMVLKPELGYHVENCPSKKDFDRHVFQEETPLPKVEMEGGVFRLEVEEKWEESDAPSYNPQAYCEKNQIIREKKVESASIRKIFRQAERQRHQMLAMQEGAKSKSKQAEKPVTSVSEREDSTLCDNTSDVLSSLTEQVTKLSIDEPPKSNNGEWTKIKGKRARGGRAKHV